MRILHVIDSLAGSGGAERGMVREISRFSSGVEQRLIHLFDRPELRHILESAGIEVRSANLSSKGGGRPWANGVRTIRQEIRDFKPDVLQTSLFQSNVVGQVAARLEGVPVVSNLVLTGDPSLLKGYQPGAASWKAAAARSLGGVAARWSKARFRAITVDALDTNARLLRVPPDRGVVIPRGVPEPIAERMTRDQLGLPAERPLVVNVGRLAAQKGQVHLIHAFTRVLAARPDAILVIVGRDGDASESVRGTIEAAGLSDSVLLTGYTPDVGHYLAHATVFAFPSLMEGLGTAVLEAMSVGLPVVAFDIPPVREVTDGGRLARLVPSGDESKLAHEIMAALDGDYADLAAAGRGHCRANYSIDSIAARVEDYLRSCATLA